MVIRITFAENKLEKENRRYQTNMAEWKRFDYSNAEKILEAKDVVVKFNLRGRVLTAIRGISMELYKGESLAIVGESGSGKSVFTKTFMGLLDQNGWVDYGSITYT